MPNKIINARIKQKRDTDSNWQSKNPVLLNGEIILVDMSDGELRSKIGNGTSTYSQLPFSDAHLRNLIGDIMDLVGDASVSEQIDDAVEQINTSLDNKSNKNHTHPVDAALSSTSTNPVQNKVLFGIVQAILDGLGGDTVENQIVDAIADCITGLTVDGTVVTYTKGDGSTGTIVTQDNDTTYSAGTGISLSGNTFSNSGVRSVSSGSSNGTISVNTNGTSADVAVKGLGSAAYTASTAYDSAGAANTALSSAKNYIDGQINSYVGDTKVSTQISNAIASKSDSTHNHDSAYDTKGAADTALASAKIYADSAATKVKNDLLNGAGAAYDTLKELGDLIDDNQDAIDALEIVAASKADASALTSHAGNKSNPHGVTAAQVGADVSGAANTALTNAKAYTDAEITEWVGDKKVSEQITAAIASKSDSGHTHDDRYYTETEVNNLLAGKAASSHGNHIPTTQTANNAVFLRNDNTWQTVTPANIGAAATSHGTHVTFDTTAPKVAGTASVGTATTVSRSDHVHPAQTNISGNAATATKATQDDSGNVITSTYATKTELNAVSTLVGDTEVSTQISNAINGITYPVTSVNGKTSAVSLAASDVGALSTSGGTVTGTLILSKTQDASGVSNNSPALIIGGTPTTAHISIDANEIIAKSNGTTPTIMYLGEADSRSIISISGVFRTNNLNFGTSLPAAGTAGRIFFKKV